MLQAMEGLGIGFRLGNLEVRPRDGSIHRPDGTVHVEPKAMDVLVALAEHAGAVVTRDELIERAWNGSPVADEPLTRCISSLRHHLADSPRAPRLLQTVPKRGYRLMVPVEPAGDPAPQRESRPASRWWHAAVVMLLAGAFALLAFPDRACSAPSQVETSGDRLVRHVATGLQRFEQHVLARVWGRGPATPTRPTTTTTKNPDAPGEADDADQ